LSRVSSRHHDASAAGPPVRYRVAGCTKRRSSSSSWEVIDAERDAIIQLRDRGAINDVVLRRLERDLDLEELRLEA